MLELTSKNIRTYLKDTGLIQPKERVSIRKVAEGGFINSVFIIKRKHNSFVVKQLLGKAQGAALTPRLERLDYEIKALQLIHKYSKNPLVPKMLNVDHKNNVLVMNLLPQKRSYKEELEQGLCREGIARKVGEFLADIHSSTWKNNDAKALENNPGYHDLRLQPSMIHSLERNPALKQILEKTLQTNAKNKFCFIHTDTTPKNILVNEKDDTISIIDFEVATYGDPAQDVGIMLAHYFLLIWKNPALLEQYLHLAYTFLQSYWNAITFCLPPQKMLRNIKNNAAIMMLGRVDGVIEFNYLKQHKSSVREAVWRIATTKCTSTADILNIVRGHFS